MEQLVAVGTKFMQEVNSAATLTQLRTARRMSVSALAGKTGLSRQAISRSLAILEADGYIEISEPDRSAAKSGRPPQMVRFRAELGYVVGIDVSPGSIRVLVADLLGEPVIDKTVPFRRGTDASIGDAVRDAVVEALDEGGISAGKVWHVSIGAPGVVDPDAGVVILIPNFEEAAGHALMTTLRHALSCPIYIDNDITLATLGERWRGRQRSGGSLVFIDWGERLGAGITINGELYRGASNDAGDLGYLDFLIDSEVSQDAEEPLGPFEHWVGTRELLRVATRLKHADPTLAEPVDLLAGAPANRVGATQTTLAELAEAAAAGAPWATQAITTIAARFAKGIAAIRALIDPAVVVIGGDISILGAALLDALNDALASQTLNQPRLELSTLGSDAIVQGAVYYSLSTIEREHFQLPAMRTA